MFSLIRRLALAGIMSILVLGAVGTSFAQTATPPPAPPPACVADAQTACVKIVFYPATLKADLFLGSDPATAQPTPQVQQSALYVTFPTPAAGQTIPVLVKNIHDGGQGEGTLYQFPDMPKTVTVPSAAGQTTTVTLYPVKKYIRGKIAAKCAPQSVLAGEDVSCVVSLDGAPQTIPAPLPTPAPDGSVPPQGPATATLAAGQTVTFIVDPGKHDVKFDLTGANAALWAPASQTKTVTVTTGTVAQIATATFVKAGHVTAKLAQADAGWVGDFYLDGTLVKPQVGSIDAWVTGNATHKVDVRNIAKTGSVLIHPYYDGTGSAYVTAGGSSTITVSMTKVPNTVLKTPDNNGQTVSLLTTDWAAWYPTHNALTAALAEDNANHILLTVLLDGMAIGDVGPYRQPAAARTTTVSCGDAAHTPCYIIGWLIPLGHLAAGQHTLHAQSAPFDTSFTDGWFMWTPGYYFYWDDAFTVNAPAP